MEQLAGMRVLSLTQPWASLVAIGAKRIETRSWATPWRGRFLIHAAKAMPAWARDCCGEPAFAEALAQAGLDGTTLPRGVLLARATLAAIVRTDAPALAAFLQRHPAEAAFGDYGPDRYGWCLTEVEPLDTPVPARGALGLWTYTPAGSAVT